MFVSLPLAARILIANSTYSDMRIIVIRIVKRILALIRIVIVIVIINSNYIIRIVIVILICSFPLAAGGAETTPDHPTEIIPTKIIIMFIYTCMYIYIYI